MSSVAPIGFSSICREWRRFRKLSQLELSLAANVSQRHLSWLETGRSVPSREMVLRLAEAMDIPLRERNVLLRAAGYAPAYGESDLLDPAMSPVLDALNHILEHHEPLPAVVVDRFWVVRKHNRAADLLLGLGGDLEAMLERVGAHGELNLALLTLHPEGLRPYIANWRIVAPLFLRRLRNEALASGDPAVRARLASYAEALGPVDTGDGATGGLLPVIPLELTIGEVRLSLFSVIATIGTPQDVTTDELRIESFYPADESTRRFFAAEAESRGDQR